MKEPKNIKYKITDLKTYIAQNDDIVKINQIIANLEDINEQDESSYTALIWAVYRNNLAIVKALLTHPNIDVNKANNDGDTALIWAAHRNNLAIVKALLTHPNIDVNKANNDGDTALYFAAHRNNLEMLQALLFHRNIDIDLLTDNIASALDYGVLRDNPQIIKDVIAFGADEGSLSDQQRTQYQDVIAEGKTILIERNTQDLEFRLKDTGRALAQISSHNFKNIAIEANAALWKNLPSEILAIITSFAVSGRVPNKFTSTEIFHYTIKDIDSFFSKPSANKRICWTIIQN